MFDVTKIWTEWSSMLNNFTSYAVDNWNEFPFAVQLTSNIIQTVLAMMIVYLVLAGVIRFILRKVARRRDNRIYTLANQLAERLDVNVDTSQLEAELETYQDLARSVNSKIDGLTTRIAALEANSSIDTDKFANSSGKIEAIYNAIFQLGDSCLSKIGGISNYASWTYETVGSLDRKLDSSTNELKTMVSKLTNQTSQSEATEVNPSSDPIAWLINDLKTNSTQWNFETMHMDSEGSTQKSLFKQVNDTTYHLTEEKDGQVIFKVKPHRNAVTSCMPLPKEQLAEVQSLAAVVVDRIEAKKVQDNVESVAKAMKLT